MYANVDAAVAELERHARVDRAPSAVIVGGLVETQIDAISVDGGELNINEALQSVYEAQDELEAA